MLKNSLDNKHFQVVDYNSITFFSSKFYFIQYFDDGTGAIKCINNPDKIIHLVSPLHIDDISILFKNIDQ